MSDTKIFILTSQKRFKSRKILNFLEILEFK